MSIEHFSELLDAEIITAVANRTYSERAIYALDSESFAILVPDYIDKKSCDGLFNKCSELNFTQKIHKTGATEARHTHYVGPTYTYGDITHNENNVWPPKLIKYKAMLEGEFLCPLNSVLINRYEKHQYIPFHRDDEPCLRDNPTIFSLSLGDERTMDVKSNDESKTFHFVLKPGTLLIMNKGFNTNYLHSVPKVKCQNLRLNLTFRYISSFSTINAHDPYILKVLKSTEKKSKKLKNTLAPNLHLHLSHILKTTFPLQIRARIYLYSKIIPSLKRM